MVCVCVCVCVMDELPESEQKLESKQAEKTGALGLITGVLLDWTREMMSLVWGVSIGCS